MKNWNIFLWLLWFSDVQAQQVPIGQWQSYPSYQNAVSVTTLRDKVFCASHNLYSYSPTTQDYKIYSKVNGLSDAEIKLIRADETSNQLVIVYVSGNIDILKQENITNIPDIKNLNLVGSKKINDVYFYNQYIYISTDFGIVVYNPLRNEIKETYSLQSAGNKAAIKSFVVYNQFFYAATDKGLFKLDENNPTPQNFANWTLVDNTSLNYLSVFNNILFAASPSKVYTINNDILSTTYTAVSDIKRLFSGTNYLYTIENGTSFKITLLNSLGQVVSSSSTRNAFDIGELTSNDLWVADGYRGLVNIGSLQNESIYNPDGPFASGSFNINFSNGKLFYTEGTNANFSPNLNNSGFSTLNNGTWTWQNRFYGYSSMSNIYDIMNLEEDKRNGYIYGASFGSGLMELHTDKTVTQYKDNGYIESVIGGPGSCRLVDLKFDNSNNLWITNSGANNQLVVKKADNSWQKFSLPINEQYKTVSDLEMDDAGQKWIVSPRGNGIVVFNDNNTIDNINDDKKIVLGTGKGNGNLPSGFTTCLAKDKTGKIWVGTISGIGIFNSPESVFTSDGRDAELKIVKYDANAGLLFSTENVTTIAVDGANNKWVGSLNGVWQITDDAETILHHFTKDNSPLPSNEVNKITINPTDGTVYIATNGGLVSYRSNATDGVLPMDNVKVFPNPVPSGYTQPIAIHGLVENADVRITDISGQLIYKTKAQGGTATWNGLTYTNRRPQTGVYYVFISNADGTETKTTKFIFNQ